MAAVFVFVATDVGHAKKYNQSSTSNSSAQKKRDDAYKEKARKHSRPVQLQRPQGRRKIPGTLAQQSHVNRGSHGRRRASAGWCRL